MDDSRPSDPLQEPHWPLVLVLVWITKRTIDPVDEAWIAAPTTRAGIQELVSACRRGEVTGWGRFAGEDFPRRIMPAEWATLIIQVVHGRRFDQPFCTISVRSAIPPRHRGEAPIVDAVIFEAKQIRDCWPPTHALVEPIEQLTEGALSELRTAAKPPKDRKKVGAPPALAGALVKDATMALEVELRSAAHLNKKKAAKLFVADWLLKNCDHVATEPTIRRHVVDPLFLRLGLAKPRNVKTHRKCQN
jgi:hypothetical protein